MPKRTPNVRMTRADYSMGLGRTNGGLGPVPRRGWDEWTSRLIALAETKGTPGLQHFYRTAPLRLLKVLISIHPMAKMAHSNNAADVCLPGNTRIVAIRHVTKVNEETGEEETSEEIDSKETELLQQFLDRYPGGLPSLQRALLKQLEWAGMYCLEAIPGKRGKGVTRGVTFDPLSLLFYDREDGGWDLAQIRYASWDAYNKSDGRDGYAGTTLGGISEIDLDTDTTFVLSLDYEDDNPYGDPWFGPFLQEGLKDLGQERNLSDILRGWAYPHISIGFPVDETLERAKNNPALLEGKGAFNEETGVNDDLTPEEYVEQEFQAFLDWLSTVNPDDPLVMPKGSESKVLDGSSGLAALDPMLKMRRHRQVMSLDQMPNRVGITEGGTQAYAEQQSRQDARKLEFGRYIINAGPVWLCNLHLRLQGKELTARADTLPILPDDRKITAEARKTEVDTDYYLVDRGAMDPEEAAIKHTGSGPYDPSRSYNQRSSGQSNPGNDSGSGNSGSSNNRASNNTVKHGRRLRRQ